MEVLDESGQPRTMFDHGERMRVRFSYEAREPVRHPNFVVALIRSDNVNCCDYSTALDGFAVPPIAGPGHIEVVTPPLKLIADQYTIHIVVWDTKFQRLYCAQIGKSFHVRHQVLSTAFGVFHESAEWSTA
jgi:lipopolysaccharide transport system ATP-binding protein